MTKELSIATIKKELMDALLNNMDILKYLQVEKYLDRGIKMTNIYNTLIFDYDASNINGDYIAVDVAEHEYSPLANAGHDFIVIIKMGLVSEKDLDKMSEIVKDIITKLYPNRERYSNIPIKMSTKYQDIGDIEKLHRMIKFTIKCK